MDNSFSQPSLLPAALPASFESDAGTSKTDFANAILEHLKKSQIIGITQSEPNPLDITQLASEFSLVSADLTARMVVVEDRTLIYRRHYTGVLDGDIRDLTFPDIGSTNYEIIVNKIVASADGAVDTGSWQIIDGTKTSTSVRIRFSEMTGDLPFDVDITIRKTNVAFA